MSNAVNNTASAVNDNANAAIDKVSPTGAYH